MNRRELLGGLLVTVLAACKNFGMPGKRGASACADSSPRDVTHPCPYVALADVTADVYD